MSTKGIRTLAGIAQELTKRGIRTARGRVSKWHPAGVGNLLRRMGMKTISRPEAQALRTELKKKGYNVTEIEDALRSRGWKGGKP